MVDLLPSKAAEKVALAGDDDMRWQIWWGGGGGSRDHGIGNVRCAYLLGMPSALVELGGITRNIVINGCCELLKVHKPPPSSGSPPAADMIAMWLVRMFMG
jgi:hypothetical protein